jgi:hypothetical protein
MIGMDQAEMRQRVIGLLTLAYETDYEAEGSGQRFADAVRSLFEDFGHYANSVSISVSAAEASAAIAELERYAQELTGQMSKDLTALASAFVSMFVGLCLYLEHQLPDGDIPTLVRVFLREQGREAASG